jgi:hypothetical protein
MQIGILGSGLMGAKLGTLFARAGHRVTFSYSHDFRKLERLARDAGRDARAGTPAEAADGADAVLLAVHSSRVGDVLKKAGTLAGQTLITCSLPMSNDDDHLVVGLKTSGAETVARKWPRASDSAWLAPLEIRSSRSRRCASCRQCRGSDLRRP